VIRPGLVSHLGHNHLRVIGGVRAEQDVIRRRVVLQVFEHQLYPGFILDHIDGRGGQWHISHGLLQSAIALCAAKMRRTHKYKTRRDTVHLPHGSIASARVRSLVTAPGYGVDLGDILEYDPN
jgi:hypothetical protein